MFQEIITYLIIAAALLLGLLKLHQRFARKKQEEGCTNKPVLKSTGCSSCGADCPVRRQ